jgi:hypothetical protein
MIGKCVFTSFFQVLQSVKVSRDCANRLWWVSFQEKFVQVPLRRTLRRGPALHRRQHCCGWLPLAVPARVVVGVFDFWVLDLLRMGPLLHTGASPMASPAIFASSGCFRIAPVARVSTCR